MLPIVRQLALVVVGTGAALGCTPRARPLRGTPVPVRLDVSRTTGNGWALRLRFAVTIAGPCMRCLEPAEPESVQDSSGGTTDSDVTVHCDDRLPIVSTTLDESTSER